MKKSYNNKMHKIKYIFIHVIAGSETYRSTVTYIDMQCMGDSGQTHGYQKDL